VRWLGDRKGIEELTKSVVTKSNFSFISHCRGIHDVSVSASATLNSPMFRFNWKWRTRSSVRLDKLLTF
jgi:hypothetical protein